jgi:coproporphyrinogen III oxidase-like Fe-S oxidoreductase
MSEQFQDRQTAVKLKIEEINKSEFIVEEGWKPNYLLIKGNKVSRVNLMGVVLDKEVKGAITNLILDDGSGKIAIRSFESIKNLEKIGIGESVSAVGKVRLFNKEKYISPEIIKKVSKDWLKIRSLELRKKEEEEVVDGKTKKVIPPHEFEEETKEFFDVTNKKIIDLIKEFDKGEGAFIEEVKEKSGMKEAEEVVEKMLKNGEIFQNSPGRVKVL